MCSVSWVTNTLRQPGKGGCTHSAGSLEGKRKRVESLRNSPKRDGEEMLFIYLTNPM